MSSSERRLRPPTHGRLPLSGAVLLLVLAACSKPGPETDAAAAAAATPAQPAAGFAIPAAQRGRIATQVVAPATYRPAVQTTGTVAFDADQSTQVLSPISGPVVRLLVPLGAPVARGEPLALVASPDYAAAIAAYRKAAATARNAERIARLDEQLFQNDALARNELEQARTDAVAAAADRDAALQQVRALGVDPAVVAALQAGRAVATPEGVIRAPIAGTLVERLITPGQLLEAGTTPAFTIADLSRMWVQASVFESDLGAVARGDSADVATAASPTPFRGVVDYIAALVDSSTKATAVRVVVPNPGRLLKKDMYVRVTIHSRKPRTGLLVPVSAVLRDEDNQPFVFVQTSGTGGYDRRTVTLGARVGDAYEVRAGLSAGDRIVVEGGLFLQFAESQ
ncbi:MAG TPA: efflux RND transporter periplasmic adaptor subunit [Gemmatimonadales bacterium]|nr:efflux RND transporter periplasmic adaptor subunit [Gemmatimonadales bacterium]